MVEWRYDFFEELEPIRMRDPLTEVLGAVAEGETLDYGYDDIVKMAGHSCPTVSGAFRVTKRALEELYGDKTPVRSQVKVTLKGGPEDGGYGPMSQVISLITGACGDEGFGGLSGFSSRKNLLIFDRDDLKRNTFVFERIDTGDTVEVKYDPRSIPGDPKMNTLLGKILRDEASKDEKAEFREMWQGRVRKVLTADDSEILEVRKPN